MKSKLLLAAALFAGLATLSIAGPGPQYWNRTKPVTTEKDVAALKPGDTVMQVCSACKTVAISEYKSAFANGRPPLRWMVVGSKHECEMCGGAITTVNGKTTDSMQHNCSKCGEGAAFCCVTTPNADKK